MLKAIQSEKKQSLKSRFHSIRAIKLCEKCKGSGKIRIGNLRSMDYDLDDCPFCMGEGSVVEKTFLSFERITPSVKSEFAR